MGFDPLDEREMHADVRDCLRYFNVHVSVPYLLEYYVSGVRGN